jgi:SOS-response transcriptional repressor LexA
MTPRQAQLLAFLRQRELAGGVSPTFDEMAAHLGLRAKSGISRIVVALEGLGAITRKPNGERAIHVVGLSEYDRGYHDGYAAAQRDRAGGRA